MGDEQRGILLRRAVRNNNYQAFLDLVDRSKINQPIYKGKTALLIFVAASRRRNYPPSCIAPREKVIDQLLEWDADINVVAPGVKTVIHQAVLNEDINMVSHLLKRGADMRKTSGKLGWTAIWSAFSIEVTDRSDKTVGHPIGELLMLHGAKPEEFRRPNLLPHRESSLQHYHVFHSRLENARHSVVIFVGLRNRSPLLKLVGKDILLQLAKNIYSTRGREFWESVVL